MEVFSLLVGEREGHVVVLLFVGLCNDGDNEFLTDGGFGACWPWYGGHGDGGGPMDGRGKFVCDGGGGKEEHSWRGDEDDADSDLLNPCPLTSSCSPPPYRTPSRSEEVR